jgi:hypothetical protein
MKHSTRMGKGAGWLVKLSLASARDTKFSLELPSTTISNSDPFSAVPARHVSKGVSCTAS